MYLIYAIVYSPLHSPVPYPYRGSVDGPRARRPGPQCTPPAPEGPIGSPTQTMQAP